MREGAVGNITGIHSQFSSIGYGISGSILMAAKVILPVFLIAMLAYTYVKSVIQRSDFQIDYGPVIRVLLLMVVVNFYGEIMSMCSLSISAVINTVPRKPSIGNAIMQMAEATMANSHDPDPSDDWWDPIVTGFESLLSVKAWLLSSIQEGILFIVRAAISLIRSMLLVFLYVVGPIAIALSAIPGFSQSGLSWLKGFVGVQFWELSLRILDNLVFEYNLRGLQNFDADLQDAGYGIAFNLVSILMYLMAPSITNYFINTGAAGGFLSRIAQTGGALMVMGRMQKMKAAASGVQKSQSAAQASSGGGSNGSASQKSLPAAQRPAMASAPPKALTSST